MQELHYHSVKLCTSISISRVAHFCITETCDPAKIYYNPPFTSSALNGLTEFLIGDFSQGINSVSAGAVSGGQREQGCAMSGDKPGATGDPAQAMPSPTGSEHGAEPGGHSNEPHQQPQTRQSNQPVPRSIRQTRARGGTGDRTTTWVRPEGKLRDMPIA